MRKEEKGITLIALVVTIVVLLILAGVSISMLTGENGIITQAQNAKIATSVAAFNEYMQMWYTNKIIEEDYDIEDLYVSSGWLDRKIETDESGNAYYIYIIDKSKVTDEEILSYMEYGKGDPYLLQDVYGINPDFTIWYRDKNGNLIASSVSVVPIDDNMEVKFSNTALSQAIANSVGIDKENYTIGDLKNVTTLKLNYDGTDTNINNLDDLYYLPSLANLYVYNLELDNLDGLKYCKKVNLIYFSKCKIDDFNGLKYNTALREITIVSDSSKEGYGIVDNNVQAFFESIKDISNLYKLSITSGTDELTNIKKINNGLQSLASKTKIGSLTLSNNYLKGELNLENYTSLTGITINDCKYITGILGLENIDGLTYFNAKNNSLEDISNLRMSSDSNAQNNHIYLKENPTLTPESIKAISQQLLNAAEYTIDYQFAQYIEGNKVLDYSSANLNDGDISNIPESVESVNLYNNSKLTSIEFLKNKSNIKVLNLSNCINIEETNLIETLLTLTGLETLNLNNLTQLNTIKFIKNMPNLKCLNISNTNVEITSIDDEDAIALNESNITELYIGATDDNKYKGNNINLTYIQGCISNLTGSVGLRLISTEEGNNKFADQLSQCTEITNLYMTYYKLEGVEEIDLTKCTKLKNIVLNGIGSNVIIKGLPDLEKLSLSNMNGGNNYYKMPDISGCNKLKSISFAGNFMTDTDLQNMCNQLKSSNTLTTLSLHINSISDISCLNNLTSLTSVNLNNNNISSLNGIEELRNLIHIQLKYNNLKTENLSSLVNLYNKYQKIRNIYLYGNNIDDYSSIYGFANKACIEEP